MIHVGDCLDILPTLPERSVHCVVTSPPYFNLRDYGTAKWDGGDPACDHVMAPAQSQNLAKSIHSTRGGAKKIAETDPLLFRDICGKCGARRIDSQIGLEPTPDCGRHGMVRLRRDLTEAQREYVVRRLLALGLLDAEPCDR